MPNPLAAAPCAERGRGPEHLPMGPERVVEDPMLPPANLSGAGDVVIG